MGPGRRPRALARLAWAMAALFVLLSSTTGHATHSLTVGSKTFPTIFVIGNGQAYTGVTAVGYGWEADIHVDGGTGAGRIKSWKIWPSLEVEGQPPLSLELYAASQSYAVFQRPKTVDKHVGTIFPGIAIRAHVVEACNRKADQLRAAGQSNATIFAQAHVITASWPLDWHVSVTAHLAASLEQASNPGQSEIICQKWQGPAVATRGASRAGWR